MLDVIRTQSLSPNGLILDTGIHSVEPRPIPGSLRQLYDLIGRSGGVERSSIRDADFSSDPDNPDDFVDFLLDEGLLEAREGHLHIGVPTDLDRTVTGRDGEYTIRVAYQDDLPGIKRVIETVASEKTAIEAETIAEKLDRDDRLIRFDEEKSRIFFVAQDDAGALVGWLHIEAPERNKLRHTARFTLGVIDDARGNGVGKRLMTVGLHWAEANGYHKVYNDFPATNRVALAFLDSLDYPAHCEAVLRDHYLIAGDFVDQMTLAVDLYGSSEALTHFDRMQREADALYSS